MPSREPLSLRATDHGVIAKECTNEGRALLLDLDMKYIDADLLRKEIEKERKSIEGLFIEGDNNFYDGQDDAYNHTLALIDSLQQEHQEVDLEKEIDACWQNWLSPSNQKEVEGVLPKTEFAMYAHHFYELGKNSK